MEKEKVYISLELIMVLVIVFILTIIMFFSYLKHIRYAMIIEGKSMMYSIAKLEKAYYVEYNYYMPIDKSSYNKELDIDARTNSYFKNFAVFVPGTEQEAEFSIVSTSGTNGLLKNVNLILHEYKNKPLVCIVNKNNN
ncbi:MAG: hypothetical protein PHH62_02850 [Endomicrobiaceae bacterium]|jgi:Tfp pilus assembly protein PilE|nr:hypothetical protein [Endomicrobiaceae bacterium]